MLTRLVISTFLLIGLVSCKEHKHNYHLEQIDSLVISLDTSFQNYLFDSSYLSQIRHDVKLNCSRVNNNHDSIIQKYFIPYSHIDKEIKKIFKMDKLIRKEFNLSKNQLSDLHHDISKNLIDEELIVPYIIEEKRIVNIITGRIEYSNKNIEAEIIKFDSLNPLIEQYLKIK